MWRTQRSGAESEEGTQHMGEEKKKNNRNVDYDYCYIYLGGNLDLSMIASCVLSSMSLAYVADDDDNATLQTIR